jgi:UDP-N-acetylmuramate--alanine ligase
MRKVHFIGVSGIGVSAVAKVAIQDGLEVSGSALEENDQTAELVKLGMRYYLGHKTEQVGSPDIVIRSAAVPSDNPEVLEARRKKIPVYLYSEYLGMLMGKKRGIAVAGTHGKTTTTAIIGTILRKAGLDPTIVCGGVMNEFSSNSVAGRGEYFVAEACEYNRSFLSLEKWYSVITNIEADHLDTYRDIHEIKSAFRKFLETTDARGLAVVNGDDNNVLDVIKACRSLEVLTVGEGSGNSYMVKEIAGENGIYSIRIEGPKGIDIELELPIPGGFNCVNFSLSAAIALELGIEKETIGEAVHDFRGMSRRLEKIGVSGSNPVYSDYAHHPTEIRATTNTLKDMYPLRRVVAVFQPHQYSRTLLLFDEFLNALKEMDLLILTEIYRQRDAERFVRAISSAGLYDELRRSMRDRIVYIKEKEDVIPYLVQIKPEDAVIVFMGAGDIDEVARKYAGK